MKRIPIIKDRLSELYVTRRQSLTQVAAQVGARSPTTVANHLRRHGIPVRLSDRRNYPKIPYSGDMKETAYLLALRAGDFYASQRHRCVVLETTSPRPAQAELARKAFGKYTTVSVLPCKGGATEKSNRISAYLDASFAFLVQKPKEIPPEVLHDDDAFVSFLAGYSDCEGCWVITSHKKYQGKWKDLQYSLATCDLKILEQINQKLKETGIESHLYLSHRAGTFTGIGRMNNDLYVVRISKRESLRRLIELLLPLSNHDEKRAKMSEMLGIIQAPPKPKLRGTVSLTCIGCGYNRLWKCGCQKSKDGRRQRYKCPQCKKESCAPTSGQLTAG